MNMPPPGADTSPIAARKWGSGTTRTPGGKTPLELQLDAYKSWAKSTGSPISQDILDSITQSQADRDERSSNIRSDQAGGL